MTHPFYDNYWKEREGRPVSNFDLKWPFLAQFIPTEPRSVILDYGCGRGEAIKEMQKVNANAKYIGLDVSKHAIERATREMPGAMFHMVTDGENFPLESSFVDFVFSSEVLEHVYDTNHAVGELARVMKSGATMLLTTPFHGFLKNVCIAMFAFDQHFDPTGGHVRFFTKRSLRDLLHVHGFEMIDCKYYGRFYPFSHSMVVLAKKT